MAWRGMSLVSVSGGVLDAPPDERLAYGRDHHQADLLRVGTAPGLEVEVADPVEVERLPVGEGFVTPSPATVTFRQPGPGSPAVTVHVPTA